MTQQENAQGSDAEDLTGGDKPQMSDTELLVAIRRELMRVYTDVLGTSPPQHIDNVVRRLSDFSREDE